MFAATLCAYFKPTRDLHRREIIETLQCLQYFIDTPLVGLFSDNIRVSEYQNQSVELNYQSAVFHPLIY